MESGLRFGIHVWKYHLIVRYKDIIFWGHLRQAPGGAGLQGGVEWGTRLGVDKVKPKEWFKYSLWIDNLEQC